MNILHMTPSRIELELNNRVVKIDGELLVPDGDVQNYVVYASSFNHWAPPHEKEELTAQEKVDVLNAVKTLLKSDKLNLEFDDEEEIYAAITSASHKTRVEAGQACSQSGWYSSPAKTNSRRFFQQGNVMPSLGGDYGVTIWQWDIDQSAPQL